MRPRVQVATPLIAFSLLFCWVCNLEFAVLGREKKMCDVCISAMEVRQLDR